MVDEPLSLLDSDVRAYWHELSPELAELFDALESKETWVADKRSSDVSDRIVRFGKRLGNCVDPDVLLDANRSDLLVFFCFLSSSKAIRLLDYLRGFDDLGTRVLEYLFEIHEAELLQAGASPKLINLLALRLGTVMTAPYLRSLINPARVDRFLAAVQQVHEERS